MVNLVVCEKPSVARDIANILNVRGRRDGYFASDKVWITWCFGHMAELVEPSAYDESWRHWSRHALPMIPDAFKLSAVDSSREQVEIITALMHDEQVTTIINACDAGREGELIFRYVYELAECDKATKRLWLSSLTDAAVKQAFRALKPGDEYDPLADAARCRSEADWLVGLNATRALTLQCRAQGAGRMLLSVGRVQTPTLAMLAIREDEIDAFVPEAFWQVFAKFDAGEQDEGIATSYEGQWIKDGVDRFDEKAAAQAVVAAVRGQTATVKSVSHRDVRDRPPSLFDLTSLQRAANQRYSMSAQATLDAAQALYEKHKILTYPRTDSNYLTSDMASTLPGVVSAVNTGPYTAFCAALLGALPLPNLTTIINDDEVGDHHAIIPTDKQPNLGALQPDEKRVYDLVVRRFLAVFFPDAIFATTQITTQAAGHLFVTKGKVRREAGWQAVDPPSRYRAGKGKGSAKGKKKEEDILPNVTRGQSVAVLKVRLNESSTKAPRRYSESALLAAMERAGNDLEDATMRRAMKESGLGTPATRASIIETLIRREYVERQGKILVPTPTGRALIGALPSADLKSAQLTGQWEARLTRVAEGKLTRDDFMREARELTARLTAELLDASPELPPELLDDEETLGTCPVCQSDVIAREKVYTCRRGRDCTFAIFKKVAQKPMTKKIVRKLLADGVTDEIEGFVSKKGSTFSARLRLSDEGRVEFAFDSALPRRPATRPPRQEEAPRCPRCQQGHIVRGRTGWGCARWREGCKLVVPFTHHSRTLTDAEGLTLFCEGQTPTLDGFIDEATGATFSARLRLDAQGVHVERQQ